MVMQKKNTPKKALGKYGKVPLGPMELMYKKTSKPPMKKKVKNKKKK